MKKSLAITFCTAAFLAAYAGTPLAQDAKTPETAVTTTPADSSMDMSKHMGPIDDHMKKMQALHDKLSSATTPEARQKIMVEQRQEMHQGMSLMKPMMQGGAGMGGMGRGMMAQKGQTGDANMQMQVMQKRMDMMQMMMQTMMDHQGMMAASPSLDAQPKK